MPTYVLRCANCGDRDVSARMKDAQHYMPCPGCGRPRPQVFFAPQFTEDRLAQWKGPMGNGWSHALGAPMPTSRQERDRLAREKGVEFCSVAELRADNKEAADALDYKAHVDAGGARNDPTPNVAADVWKERP